MVENMLAKVDKFCFPIDFIVLDIEMDQEIPLILVWSLLATCRAKTDVKEGLLTLRVGKRRFSSAFWNQLLALVMRSVKVAFYGVDL